MNWKGRARGRRGAPCCLLSVFAPRLPPASGERVTSLLPVVEQGVCHEKLAPVTATHYVSMGTSVRRGIGSPLSWYQSPP